MRIDGLLQGCGVLVVALLSTAFIVSKSPEEMVVALEDPAVTLSGRAYASAPLTLQAVPRETIHESSLHPDGSFVSSVVVAGPLSDLPYEATLRFVTDSLSATLWRFYSQLQMWQIVDHAAREADAIVLSTHQLGSFAVLDVDFPESLPDRAGIYSILLADAPAGTVSYDFSTALVTVEGETVGVPGEIVSGACGGVRRTGARTEEYSSRVLPIEIAAPFERAVVVARWFIGEGCPAGESLQPLL